MLLLICRHSYRKTLGVFALWTSPSLSLSKKKITYTKKEYCLHCEVSIVFPQDGFIRISEVANAIFCSVLDLRAP
jgi:hypothetical protein